MIKRLSLMIVWLLPLGALTIMVGTAQAQEIELPSLTEPGPYDVYHTEMTFVDEVRGDWALKTLIWYPAYTVAKSRESVVRAPGSKVKPGPVVLGIQSNWLFCIAQDIT